jgi:hypothetical protein
VSLRHEDADDDREAVLRGIVCAALLPGGPAESAGQAAGVEALSSAQWRDRSDPMWHAYRWIERRFSDSEHKGSGPLMQTFETPAQLVVGSGASGAQALRALPGADPGFSERVLTGILGRFAWADGISAHLSDTYRGSMVMNFALSAAAVISGVAYLPLVGNGRSRRSNSCSSARSSPSPGSASAAAGMVDGSRRVVSPNTFAMHRCCWRSAPRARRAAGCAVPRPRGPSTMCVMRSARRACRA